MNKVILVGRLTKDAEIRTTQTGKKVASFSIAVDDGKDTSGQRLTSYFNCTAWDSLADLIEQYVKKGHRLAITGKLQNRSWDKPDGTKGFATDISVRELEMLTTRLEAGNIANLEKPQTNDKLPEISVDDFNKEIEATSANLPF